MWGIKKGEKNQILGNEHPTLTPPSKVRAFPCVFTLLAVISPAWAQATRLKEIISFKKEVCARVPGTSLPLPPCIPQGKVKERSGFWRNWARGAQRVSASLGEEQGRCFLQNEDDSHQSCAAPFAQMNFLKKRTRNELKRSSQSTGTPTVTQPQGAGWWRKPPSTSCTRWHADGGQWGGCFCPLPSYLPPVLLPPACTNRGGSSATARREEKRGKVERG